MAENRINLFFTNIMTFNMTEQAWDKNISQSSSIIYINHHLEQKEGSLARKMSGLKRTPIPNLEDSGSLFSSTKCFCCHWLAEGTDRYLWCLSAYQRSDWSQPPSVSPYLLHTSESMLASQLLSLLSHPKLQPTSRLPSPSHSLSL